MNIAPQDLNRGSVGQDWFDQVHVPACYTLLFRPHTTGTLLRGTPIYTKVNTSEVARRRSGVPRYRECLILTRCGLSRATALGRRIIDIYVYTATGSKYPTTPS